MSSAGIAHLFLEIAQSLGVKGIHHTDFGATRNTLKDLGLTLED